MEKGRKRGVFKVLDGEGREDKGSGSVRVISRVIFTLFTVRVRVIFTVEQLWWEATVEEVASLKSLFFSVWKNVEEFVEGFRHSLVLETNLGSFCFLS